MADKRGMGTTNDTTATDALPRYRVVEDASAPGAFDVMDTRTACGGWRVIEAHSGRADAAAAFWNARATGIRS